MTVECIVGKLAYLMGKGYRGESLKTRFEKPIRGEMTSTEDIHGRVVEFRSEQSAIPHTREGTFPKRIKALLEMEPNASSTSLKSNSSNSASLRSFEETPKKISWRASRREFEDGSNSERTDNDEVGDGTNEDEMGTVCKLSDEMQGEF